MEKIEYNPHYVASQIAAKLEAIPYISIIDIEEGTDTLYTDLSDEGFTIEGIIINIEIMGCVYDETVVINTLKPEIWVYDHGCEIAINYTDNFDYNKNWGSNLDDALINHYSARVNA